MNGTKFVRLNILINKDRCYLRIMCEFSLRIITGISFKEEIYILNGLVKSRQVAIYKINK